MRTSEQERFRIFAMTHKKPTQAADEWLADRRELAALREAARELTLPVRVVCCHCSQSTMWIPDTPEALLQGEQ